MTLSEFFKSYPHLESQKSFLEKKFITDVFYPDYGDRGLDFLSSQAKIYNDSTGEKYFIDFVLNTPTTKYAIETDGLYYHASGAVSGDYYDKLQRKQNEMQNQGFRIIRLTSNNIMNSPKEARYELRRAFIADKLLNEIRYGITAEIRPHEIQEEALDALATTRAGGSDKGLVVLATGVGKTYLSAFDVRNTGSEKVLFVVHIKEILRQSRMSFEDVLYDKIDDMGFLHGEIKDIKKNILFSSIQTIGREKYIRNFAPDYFDYIIIDETHHVAAESYSRLFNYFKPKKFFLGLTATKDRADKKEILQFFDNNLVYEIDQKTAIDKALLVPYKYFGFKDDIDYSDIRWNGFKYSVQDLNKALMIEKRDKAILEKFNEYGCSKRKTIGFCVSIEHANYMANLFNKHGIKAIAIHSKNDDETDMIDSPREIDEKIKSFRRGDYQVAFVVDMFNEGVDVKDVSCLLFLRPTESKTIFVQQMGRGLRLSPETQKCDVIILDFIGNYKTAIKVLSGLGVSIGDFKKPEVAQGGEREQKMLYRYDNNGSKVYFQDEVIDVLKEIQSASVKEVRKDLITEKWREYGEYLEQASVDNLYFKIGNQNKDIVAQLQALSILKHNPGSSDEEFKILLEQNGVSDMKAGFRGLFLSKLLGLFRTEGHEVTNVFSEIESRIINKNDDFSAIAKYNDLLTRQLEKVAYFSPINSPTNKYISKAERVQYNEIKNYIVPFIMLLIMELRENYGYKDNRLSTEEIRYFATFARRLEEYNDVVEMIIEYRTYKDRPELNKFLAQATQKADSRLLSILKHVSYFSLDGSGVKIPDAYIEETLYKYHALRQLLTQGGIVSPSDETRYKEMLYSGDSMIDFCKKRPTSP